ncbi:MAG: glycosyltransferase [Terriglobales bacterium]|jgi:GT2 family glycosyltransferase
MPAVSVISTVLNEADDIGALVESLMRQTLAPAEVIIVDGGSTDGTWERLEAARSKYAALVAIRDESCNLRRSPGPIARGRNVAIAAAASDVVACADAGCTYDADWLANLTAPILTGDSEYSLGGAYIDLTKIDLTRSDLAKSDLTKPDSGQSTVWDVASAPFFGVKLNPGAATKSSTARSMAFRKGLWRRAGGFPETVFFGEDTLFDAKARQFARPAFAERAKASYRPRHSFGSAVRQMADYSAAWGVLGGRWARLWRNLARCLAEILAALALAYSPIPLVLVLALEFYFAFRLDWSDLRKAPWRMLGARLVYSAIVPWVAAWTQCAGSITKKFRPNRQNFA